MSATASARAGMRDLPIARVAVLFVALALVAATASFAQEPPAPVQPSAQTPSDDRGGAERAGRFLLGAAAGLGFHEGGHLLFDGLFGVEPTLKKVDFGGIPFFAITHQAGLSPRTEFTITSAGFWMQHLSSEIVLTRHPGLREETSPTRKGLLAFNVLASVAYGSAAIAKAGPAERDTRAMAAALGVDEAWVGVLVLVPAGLDAWRYFHPESRWAAWLSRGVKVGSVLLVIK
jgi:hypothetical protein